MKFANIIKIISKYIQILFVSFQSKQKPLIEMSFKKVDIEALIPGTILQSTSYFYLWNWDETAPNAYMNPGDQCMILEKISFIANRSSMNKPTTKLKVLIFGSDVVSSIRVDEEHFYICVNQWGDNFNVVSL